jgi:hypothetical protein
MGEPLYSNMELFRAYRRAGRDIQGYKRAIRELVKAYRRAWRVLRSLKWLRELGWSYKRAIRAK